MLKSFFAVVIRREVASLGIRSCTSTAAVPAAATETLLPPPESLRLSKLLSLSGYCSRSEAEKWITAGRVSVNGTVTTCPFSQIEPADVVRLDDELLLKKYCPSEANIPKLWAVNKLQGEIVAHKDDEKKRPTLFSRLRHLQSQGTEVSKLKPVTRLDYNVEGLCIVTNNGALARAMESPKSLLKRTFRVKVHGLLNESKLDGLRKGIFVDNVRQPPFEVTVERSGGTNTWLDISFTEANVKSMIFCLEKVHLKATRVICVGFGPYRLGGLSPGAIAPLKLHRDVLRLFRRTISGEKEG